jgi:hypothetical protein
VKVKKDYVPGLGLNDGFDLVPIGGYHGNGRKAGWIRSPLSLVLRHSRLFAKMQSIFDGSVRSQDRAIGGILQSYERIHG